MTVLAAMKTRARARVALVLLACGLAAVALTGGAAMVRAATAPGITVTDSVVNDESATIPGQPSPGGNIGYTITATNTLTSTANHLSLVGSINPAGPVVYVSSTNITCPAVDPAAPTNTISCQATKLDPGASFSVTVLFRTSAAALPGSTVTGNFQVAFDSQTNGPANQKTLIVPPIPRTMDGAADGSVAESVSLHGEKLAAGGLGQTSDITMPGGFLNGIPYVGARVENDPDASPCTGCAPFKTEITIPSASTFNTTGPFWDNNAHPAQPFSWTLTLPGSLLPKGFKLHGVFHDGVLLPMCALDSGGHPVPTTTAPGICVATLVQKQSTKTITATGLALSNGRYQFG